MLLTEDEFREIHVTDTATDVHSAQILLALNKAKNKIIGLVGAVAVTDAEEASPTDTTRADCLRNAQGNFALSSLLTVRSTRFRDGGIMKTERDETAGSTNTYESYGEIRKAKADLEAEAMEMLDAYLLANQTVESFEADRIWTENVPIGWGW